MYKLDKPFKAAELVLSSMQTKVLPQISSTVHGGVQWRLSSRRLLRALTAVAELQLYNRRF